MTLKERVQTGGVPTNSPEPAPPPPLTSAAFSATARWIILLAGVFLALFLLIHVRSIVFPFVWAIVVAYLLSPVVTYLSENLRLPRFLVVLAMYIVFFSAVVAASRYLIPWVSSQITYFVEDLPKLQGSLVSKVGRRPLGIDINDVVNQIAARLNRLTGNPKSATKLLQSAFTTTVRILLFLFSTFYLLMDAPRIKQALVHFIPEVYRGEILQLGRKINSTWTEYIRGELILFAIMSVASLIGLEILRVPGAVPLAIATGVLELLPIVGPITAGALAVSVGYLEGTNPFGWNQLTYGLVIAAMYLFFRQVEDYIVVPRVLGRAVRLHPLVILFALACGGVLLGLFGLIIAVPVAASVKIIGAYLYDKLVPQPPQFADIHAVNTE